MGSGQARQARQAALRSSGWVCTVAGEVIAWPALFKGLPELSPRQRLQ